MSARSWSLFAPILSTLALGIPGTARAQADVSPAPRPDVAAAATAFDRGLADMEASRYETGCPLLAESFRLDPLPGVLFSEAECEARWGKIATAVAHFDDFLNLVQGLAPEQKQKHQERVRIAQERRTKLGPDVPHLTLALPAGAPRGTTVQRDGVALGAPLLGVELSVDPGEHRVTTQAPGGPSHEVVVSLAPGAHERVVLVVEPPTTPPRAERAARAPTPDAAADPSSGRRTLAYVAGGIGIAGVVVGVVTGLVAAGKKSTVDADCDGTHCRTPEGKDAGESGRTFALASTIAFGIGIAGIGAGVVLLVTGPSAPKTTNPTSAPRAAVVALSGSW